MSNSFTKTTLALVLAVFGLLPGAWAQSANAPSAADCKAPTNQKLMNECAYEDFLKANSGYAESNKSISGKLSGKQRELFRRSQTAWMAYRTAACDFESSAVQGGSAYRMVKWQCTARMTRERVAELIKVGNCAEGDLACVRYKK